VHLRKKAEEEILKIYIVVEKPFHKMKGNSALKKMYEAGISIY
jgi:hypothetical protein